MLMYEDLTEKIIGAFYNVHNELGPGYLESIYKNALIVDFKESGLSYDTEKMIEIFYHNKKVGEHRLDIVIENAVIIEVKAVSEFHPAHQAQIISYLKATRLKVGLLVNFGKDKVEYKRFVF